jgi:D-isomer specific 2-hydroxyacid dehydrogenase, NAD binding domain
LQTTEQNLASLRLCLDILLQLPQCTKGNFTVGLAIEGEMRLRQIEEVAVPVSQLSISTMCQRPAAKALAKPGTLAICRPPLSALAAAPGCSLTASRIARVVAQMKSTAFLINTARGGMVDEAALYDALSSGKLAGAALDVFDEEPLPLDSPLLKLPNFLAAPHVAGLTREAAARMAEVTVRNILGVLDGQPNRELMLNREVLRSAAPLAATNNSK